MVLRRQRRGKFEARSFIDSDGFRWWLEEDPDHWPRSIEER